MTTTNEALQNAGLLLALQQLCKWADELDADARVEGFGGGSATAKKIWGIAKPAIEAAEQGNRGPATSAGGRTYTREDVQQWRDDVAHAAADMVQRAAPAFGGGDWSWLVNGIRALANNQHSEGGTVLDKDALTDDEIHEIADDYRDEHYACGVHVQTFDALGFARALLQREKTGGAA